MITFFRSPKLRAAIILSLAPTALTSTGFAFAEVARGSLLLQTNASATYDSYFIGTVDNAPDTIYTVYPSLRYSRNAGRGSISANAGVAFNKYEENRDLDSSDLRAAFGIDLPFVEGARLNGNFNVDYSEATIVDLYVNDRVVTRTFSSNFGLEYQLSALSSISESFTYSNTLREVYSDQEMFSNSISYTYSGFLRGSSLSLTHDLTLTETTGDDFTGIGLDQQSNSLSLDLSRPIYGEVTGTASLGYSVLTRSEDETFNGESRSQSGFFSLSIDGPFLPRRYFPKLTSSASISYSQPAFAGLNDNAGKFLSGHANVSWNARERTKFHVNASRSFDLSATNVGIESNRIGGGFNQQIGMHTSLSGSAGYSWNSSRGVDREDTLLDASLNLSRTFNKYLSASVGYTFEDNDTSFTGYQPGRYAPRDYIRHTATGTVTVTF